MTDLIYKPEIFSLFLNDSNNKKDAEDNFSYSQPVGERKTLEKFIFGFQIFFIALCFLIFGYELISLKFHILIPLSNILLNLNLISDNIFDYLQSKKFIHQLGDVAGIFTLITLIYPLHKKLFKVFKYLSSALSWLDWHIFFGTSACIIIIFHVAFKPVGFLGFLLLGSLGLVIITGALGRYLYVSIPEEASTLESSHFQLEDAELTRKLEIFFATSDRSRAFISKMTSVLNISYPELNIKITGFVAIIKFCNKLIFGSFLIFFNDFMRILRLAKIRLFMPSELKVHGYQLAKFLEIINKKAQVKRNIALLKTLKQFSYAWYMLHNPASYLFFYLLAVHVFVSIVFR